MLTAVLPGLRDLRTPLATGYLWLLNVWILVGHLLPRERPGGDGVLAKLFDLGSFFGTGALIGVLTFTAYLMGALLGIDVQARVVRLLLKKPVSAPIRDSLLEFTELQVSQLLAADRHRWEGRRDE